MNEISEIERIKFQANATKSVTDAMFGKMSQLKRKVYAEDFTDTVQDIVVCVLGTFEREDRSVGYYGGYTAERVWLVNDLSQTNIFALLTDERVEQLEEKGAQIMGQRAIEEAADAAEMYRDMER